MHEPTPKDHLVGLPTVGTCRRRKVPDVYLVGHAWVRFVKEKVAYPNPSGPPHVPTQREKRDRRCVRASLRHGAARFHLLPLEPA